MNSISYFRRWIKIKILSLEKYKRHLRRLNKENLIFLNIINLNSCIYLSCCLKSSVIFSTQYIINRVSYFFRITPSESGQYFLLKKPKIRFFVKSFFKNKIFLKFKLWDVNISIYSQFLLISVSRFALFELQMFDCIE